MSRLRAAFDQAVAGTAAAMLISGDAGVGKTRLTDELAALARAKDAVVLTGRCLDAGETGLPYLPFVEAMAQVPDREAGGARPSRAGPAAARRDPAERRAGRRAACPASARSCPVPARARPPPPSRTSASCSCSTPCTRCSPTSPPTPPWCWSSRTCTGPTAPPAGCSSFLVSRLRDQRLLIVGTYRSDDLHRRHPLRPLLAELVRLPATERLELTPFDEADSRAFVTALAEELLPEDTVREVAGRSEGNAFFAEELLAAYTEDGDEPAGDAGRRAAVPGRAARRARPAGDPGGVGGRPAGAARDAARRSSELSETELEEALREAVQHHVLVATEDRGCEVYAFRHALLREAVYGDLLPGERVRLHAAYARELAGQHGQRGAAAALAHHSMESHAAAAGAGRVGRGGAGGQAGAVRRPRRCTTSSAR